MIICCDLGKTLNTLKVPGVPRCVNRCSVKNVGVTSNPTMDYHPIQEEEEQQSPS